MSWRGRWSQAAVALVLFAAGWVCACVAVQHQASERMAVLEESHALAIAGIRQRIYGSNDFHCKGISPESDKMLQGFDPSASKGTISMSYVGGMGGADVRIQINGDGSVVLTDRGVSRMVRTLDAKRCSEFFMKTITSGILNYSDAVIGLKCNLARPSVSRSVTDASTTHVRIFIPELDIQKEFSVYAPKFELRNYPDIIEFQLVTALEEEILGFFPKDDPFLK